MRVLRDECVPRPLKRHLAEHAVSTVTEMGWSGTENGVLLAFIRAEAFDAFVTVDQGLPYQQNLQDAVVAAVVLVAHGNRPQDLELLMPALKEALRTIRRTELLRVGA